MKTVTAIPLTWRLTFFALWTLCLLPVVEELPGVVLMAALMFWVIAFLLQRLGSGAGAWIKNSVRLLLLVAAVAVAWLQRQGGMRLEDAVHFFVFLPILKNMELSEARDRRMQLLILLLLWSAGLLLCSQLAWLGASVVMAVLMAWLLQQSHRPFPIMDGAQFRRSVIMVVAALPVALAFFILFPRLQFFGRIYWPAAKSGISSLIRPGDLAALSLDDSMFANVLYQQPPSTSGLQYWRYATLGQSRDGWEWNRGNIRPQVLRAAGPESLRETYEVYYQQMGEGMLLVREGTAAVSARTRMNITHHRDQTFSAIYFQGKNPYYAGEWRAQAIDDRPGKQDVAVPEQVGTGMRSLAAQLKAASPAQTPIEILQSFFSKNFSYSLTPGTYTSMEQFALEGRRGYCEHYAALSATLLRLWNIPARVVVGFLIHQTSGDASLNILNSDAHAWVEYWDEAAARWQRFDPTMVVAPDRARLTQQEWRQGQNGADNSFSSFWRNSFLRRTFATAHTFYLRVNLWMINYDRDEQRKVWRFEAGQARRLWLLVGGIVIVLSLLLWMYNRRMWRSSLDPLSREWQRAITRWFGREATLQGGSPHLWNHWARSRWKNAAEYEQLVKFYCHLRYGRERRQAHLSQLRQAIARFHPQVIKKHDQKL